VLFFFLFFFFCVLFLVRTVLVFLLQAPGGRLDLLCPVSFPDPGKKQLLRTHFSSQVGVEDPSLVLLLGIDYIKSNMDLSPFPDAASSPSSLRCLGFCIPFPWTRLWDFSS